MGQPTGPEHGQPMCSAWTAAPVVRLASAWCRPASQPCMNTAWCPPPCRRSPWA